MIVPQRLVHEITPAERRAAGVAAAAGAALVVLTLGLQASGSSPAAADMHVRSLAHRMGGDLSEASLKQMVAAMDPSTADVARRFDPRDFTPEQPLVGSPKDEPQLLALQEAQDAAARAENAAIPFATDVVPAAPFILHAASKAERERAVRCLTNAIYYEAALEPIDGQRAVAQVVLNRVRDPDFPKSICGVVYEGWEKDTGCQFSFTCDGALVRTPIAALWNEDRKIAEAALNGYVMGKIGMATHYHADYVSPAWAPTLVKIGQIGAHIFYRWPGKAGLPQAFTAAYAGGEGRFSEAVLEGKAARPNAQTVDKAPAMGLPGLPGTTLPGLPGLRSVAMADAKGQVKVRVQGSFIPASPTGEYGRRQATPEEIARINQMLEERFPTKPAAETATTAASPAPQTVSQAQPIATASAG